MKPNYIPVLIGNLADSFSGIPVKNIYMGYGAKLRSSLESQNLLVSPGVHDPLSARIADDVGFELVSMTGNGTSLSKVGSPDVGVMTMTEAVENAKNIQQAVDIPLICDADNGYGNAVNVRRTVEEFAQAGVAAVHIEDQVFPKRCGFVDGKQVISQAEAEGKIQAAATTRDEHAPEMVLIARTDARSAPSGSLEEAINRANGYCEAGADAAFVQGAHSAAELKEIGQAVSAPLVYNCSSGSPVVPLDRVSEIGYNIAIFPRMSTYPMIETLFERFVALKNEGTDAWLETKTAFEQAPIEGYDSFAGVPEVLSWEDKYLPDS